MSTTIINIPDIYFYFNSTMSTTIINIDKIRSNPERTNVTRDMLDDIV